MSQIKKTDLIQEVIEVAGLGTMDKKPSTLMSSVIPVIDVNPKHARITNVVKQIATGASGSQTVYTTPSNQDFYLTYLHLSYQCSSTADNTYIQISAPINGATISLIYCIKNTLTAKEGDLVVTFPQPIKIDRSGTIEHSTSFTAGTVSRSTTIGGYVVNNY